MKWLFILLLIINLALFGWMFTREEEPSGPQTVAASDKGGIRLLSEVRQEEEARKAEEAAALAAQEAEEEAREAAEMAAQQPESDTEVEETAEEQFPEMAMDAPQPEAEPQQDAEPEPEFIYVQKPTEPLLAGVLGITEQCGILGPIGDRQKAGSAEEILQNAGIEVWVNEQSERTKIGYWVVIPALENTEQVQEKIQELADAGIKDIWVFQAGELKNSISLGMFSQEENANNYSQVAASKGFDTELRPRYLNKKRYRLGFRIENSEPVIRSMWQQIELQYPQYELNMTPCEQIATP
jgi:flagellar biosynthesis GTPase FlhF